VAGGRGASAGASAAAAALPDAAARASLAPAASSSSMSAPSAAAARPRFLGGTDAAAATARGATTPAFTFSPGTAVQYSGRRSCTAPGPEANSEAAPARASRNLVVAQPLPFPPPSFTAPA
jgi:hypothetical protein